MREAKNGEDAADAEGGWLDWLARLRRRRRSAASTPARWSATSATAARCAAGSSPPSSAEAEARERVAAEPSMAGADLARDGDAGRAGASSTASGPHVVGIDTGIKLSIIRQFRERNCRVTLLPCTASAEEVLARGPGPGLPRQRPRRPGGARLRRRQRPRAGRQEARVRHLPRPPAALPGGRPRDLQAPVRPPRRQPPGQGPRDRAGSTSPRRTTASRSAGPAASRRSRATSRCAGRPTSAPPSSRTSTSTTARSRAWCCATCPAPRSSTTPRPGPGPHDARYLFDRFLEMAAA